MEPKFYRSLSRNIALMERAIHLDVNDDVVVRRFEALGQSCVLYYVEGMSSGVQMSEHVLRPLMGSALRAVGGKAAQMAMEEVVEVTETKLEKEPHAAIAELFRGQSLLLIDTCDEAVVIDLRFYIRRAIPTPHTENAAIGPNEAFNESLRDNLTLLHKRLCTPSFICKICEVGTETSVQVAICYLDGICRAEWVEEMEKRIKSAALDYVIGACVLEQLIEDDPIAPLSQMVSTERPDRAVSFLMEGQVVVLQDGSPRASAMPASLWHRFHAPDDSYMRWQSGTFMRLLRLLGALVALLLPAVFISLVLYHPMTIPMTLLTSIMKSRTAVPGSLFGEAVLMVIIFNLINESSMRIPNLMGSSLGLVSTLILGTAAVEAGLVSPLLIVVVALSGVGSFALPDYPLSLSFRMGQVILLIVAGWTGVTGLCFALVLLVCWVAGMESLGEPFLAPTSPRRSHNPDLLFRAPTFRQRLRAYLSNPTEMDRAKGRMRRFNEGRHRK